MMRRLLRSTCAIALIALASSTVSALDSVSIVATAPAAYEAGAAPGEYTISRTGTTGALTVLLTVGGTAISGTDFTALPASVIIPDGASFVLLPITPIDDVLAEGGETAVVTITANATTYDLGTPFSAQVAIGDDEVSASVQMGSIVSYEPFISPPGTPTNFFNSDIMRVQFTSSTFNRRLIIDLGGVAAPGVDYDFYYMYGHDAGFSIGTIKDIGRRSLDGDVVGGLSTISAGPPVITGYLQGATHLQAQAGRSLSGFGHFEDNDIIQIVGDTQLYVIFNVTPAGAVASVGATYDFDIFPGLKKQIINGTAIDTAQLVNMTGINRLQLNVPAGYGQVEFQMVPKNDAESEGAEDITLAIQSTTDYAIRDPVIGTAYIGDTTVVASIDLTNNSIEGATPGIATVRFQGAFPRAITVPYVVSGTAVRGVDYTIVGLNNATGIGSVSLPANTSSAVITVNAISDGVVEGIETVTITLADTLDYQVQGSSGSTLNPSATINIGDPTSGIVIVPVTTTGTGTTGGTTAGVRPLPTNGSSGGCGLGSGAALLIGFAAIGFARRRRSA